MLQVAGATLRQVLRQCGDAVRIERRRVRPQRPGRRRRDVGRPCGVTDPQEGPGGAAADPVRHLGQEATGGHPPGAAQAGDQAVNGHRDP